MQELENILPMHFQNRQLNVLYTSIKCFALFNKNIDRSNFSSLARI